MLNSKQWTLNALCILCPKETYERMILSVYVDTFCVFESLPVR